MKRSLCEKALFGTGETLPTDISRLIVRQNKSVVMLDVTVALGTPYDRLIYRFRIESFNHR
jgi:hypothetical protein